LAVDDVEDLDRVGRVETGAGRLGGVEKPVADDAGAGRTKRLDGMKDDVVGDQGNENVRPEDEAKVQPIVRRAGQTGRSPTPERVKAATSSAKVVPSPAIPW
jgi:hypothetical protein